MDHRDVAIMSVAEVDNDQQQLNQACTQLRRSVVEYKLNWSIDVNSVWLTTASMMH